MRRWCAFVFCGGLLLALRGPEASLALAFPWNVRGTFLPGQPVSVVVVAWPNLRIDASLYRISLNQVIALAEKSRDLEASDLASQRPLRRAMLPPSPAAAGEAERRITFGTLPIGEYAVVCEVGGTRFAQRISVTTLGTLWAQSWGGDAFAYAVDLRTMHRRDDVRFDYHGIGAVRTALTDANGLARLTGTIDVDHRGLLVGHASDGSVALTDVWGSGAGVRERLYIQTDRPLYRPGQRMYYRAIVRTGGIGAYGIPVGDRTVTVRGTGGEVLATQSRRVDDFGTLSGDVQIPPDAQLGLYYIYIGDVPWASVRIQDYRKPEYVIDLRRGSRSVVGGEAATFSIEARYFFGRPAAALRVHYSAEVTASQYETALWRFSSLYHFHGSSDSFDWSTRTLAAGDASTDENGRAVITVPTKTVTYDQELRLKVDARDQSGQTVSAETSVVVAPASFALRVWPRVSFGRAGEDVPLDVQARAYEDDRGVPRVAVDLDFERVEYRLSGLSEERTPAGHQRVTTGPDGVVVARWVPASPGYYVVHAVARDGSGRLSEGETWVWVAGERWGAPYRFDGLAVVPQKASYAPNERARLLVTSPEAGADALVLVGANRHYSARVVRLQQNITVLEVDPPRDAASYVVNVAVPKASGIDRAMARVIVSPPARQLSVRVAPLAPKYAPGARARFELDVRDGRGRPARAEVGLAVVDDALLVLADRRDGGAFQALYSGYGNAYSGPSWSPVGEPGVRYSDDARPLLSIGRVGASSTTQFAAPAADTYPADQAGPPSFEGLRSDFRDTAFWSPSVVTDAAGHATVEFTWPDSLTSYTARAVAVTRATDVGEGEAHALVTKDFLVRLEAPRFLRRGDDSRITGIAHGASTATSAALRLSAPELGVPDARAQVAFDRNLSASRTWDVGAGDLGTANLRLAGTSGSLHDGLRVSLPVESAGSAQHLRDAGMLGDRARIDLPLPGSYEAGELRIDLAPSAVASLVQNVRLLDVYPYACVEQTMSSALPAVIVERLLKRAHLRVPDGLRPSEISAKALKRLEALQHDDGSWGWWEDDAAHPFMTAYAVYGLAELRRSGYAVKDWTISRGVASLLAQLATSNDDTLAFWGGRQRGSQWNTRAFMLYALADAAPERVDRAVLAETDARASEMNPYAIATLGLAHDAIGDRPGAAAMLARLDAEAIEEDPYTHWRGASWHYGWEDDPVETTAYALRLEVAVKPDSPRVARAVTWLRSQERGSWWYTTKDTAAAIYALSEATSPQVSEFSPHESVRLSLNGRVVKEVRVDQPVLSASDASVIVPAQALKAGGTLVVERSGRGALYWSTDWTRYVPDGTKVAFDEGSRSADRESAGARSPFVISRTYETAHQGPWHVGDVVKVDVLAATSEDTQYVAIEDPFPAGLEYQPLQHETGDDWSGVQFFDDRAVFFATRVSSRETIHLAYRLRVTTPGSYTAPPPSAYAMYGPPIAALGRATRVRVADAR